MEPHIIFLKLLLAIGIGAIIGIEREVWKQRFRYYDFAGIRSFILISILGFLSAFFSIEILKNPYTFIIPFSILSIAIIVAYYAVTKKAGKIGITTELSAILCFLAGALALTKYSFFAVIIAVITAALLALKLELHKFAGNITKEDLFAASKLLIISLITLPFLPNKEYGPMDIPGINNLFALLNIQDLGSKLTVFNPYNIWLMVILIASISFVGYTLIRTIGTKKGLILSGFIGGLISSTAVTIALSEETKRFPKANAKASNIFIIGTIGASLISFFRTLFIILIISPMLIKEIFIPILSISFISIITLILFYKNIQKQRQGKITKFKMPFAITPAIKFGLLLSLALLVIKILQNTIGNQGIYIGSFLGGLFDIDAVTLSLASFNIANITPLSIAGAGIIFAISANLLSKGIISYVIGEKRFGKIIFSLFFSLSLIALLLVL